MLIIMMIINNHTILIKDSFTFYGDQLKIIINISMTITLISPV
jgi:hypothetical protein